MGVEPRRTDKHKRNGAEKGAAFHQSILLPEKEDIVARLSHSTGNISPSHWHDALEIIYLARGSLTVRLPEGEYELAANQFVVINSGQVHSTCCLHGNNALLLMLPDSFLNRYVSQGETVLYAVPIDAQEEQVSIRLDAVRRVLEQMYLLLEAAPDGGRLKFQSCLFELLYLLYHHFRVPLTLTGSDRRNRDFSILRPVLAFTEQHYTETVSVETAAAVAGLQPNYFCRYFKKHTGYTYLEYQHMQRMSRIVEDLLNTADPVGAILDRHGFTNQKLFRRLFREQFHISPTGFRKQFRKNGDPERERAAKY